MLESKKDDPPPRAGVQARKREGNSSVNAILGSHGDREELRLILSVRELLKQSAGRFTRHPDPESVYDPFLPGTEQGGHVMGSRPRAPRTRGQPHPGRVGGPTQGQPPERAQTTPRDFAQAYREAADALKAVGGDPEPEKSKRSCSYSTRSSEARQPPAFGSGAGMKSSGSVPSFGKVASFDPSDG